MKEKLIILLLLPVLFAAEGGCASQSVRNQLPLSGYEALEVMPVANETGESFHFDVAAEITRHILSRLRQEGFNVAAASGNTLVISSSLTSYETQVAGTASCTVKTALIDKQTGKVLDVITTRSSVSAGGLPQLGLKTETAVLEMAAGEIVSQIEKRIRPRR